MNLDVILRAGISTGTILLIAAIGEILSERSGIQNLGVEGMMLFGAMAAFKVSYESGSVILALLAAIGAGGLLSLAHALVTIHFQADQTVSGLSLTFLGTGLALVLGKPLGVVGVSWLMVRLGWCRLPPGVSWSGIVLIGLLAGVGFTMSIFIAMLAFDNEILLGAAKLGVLAGSLVAAVLGLAWGTMYRRTTKAL